VGPIGSRIRPVGGRHRSACANSPSGPAAAPGRRVGAIEVPSKSNQWWAVTTIVALAPPRLLGGPTSRPH